MAVYERTYKPFQGTLTPRRGRFLVIPRYAFQEIFASKGFVAFFVACFVVPLFWAVVIYGSYNLTLLERLAAFTGQTVSPGGLRLFEGEKLVFGFVHPQIWMAFFMAFIVGPALVSSDLQNNGLPLYLSRPFSRADYILGKLSVLVILLSVVTWIPGTLLFLLNAYLAGWDWVGENIRILLAMIVGFGISIMLFSLISLALSAYMRWKPLARLALFGVFIILGLMGGVTNQMLSTQWGTVINLVELLLVVWAGLMEIRPPDSIPIWAAWVSLVGACLFFLGLLVRKIRAYEVVS